ncbi:acyl-CoA dehydrogenase [Streptomyces ruber]|uniref:Acyl-CoA dehydrogenase n=2 Tax=Streptomyces TaxID=1883 RepID=A0A918BD56_9ACTN|nr:acyl-CoA dehydrogenase family protein [Streptomyces ruber]GGQ60606.1 acyl-CoA dehydrogenase [Streptomyces ruber]
MATTPKARLTELAADLEKYLGDPDDPGSRIPFTRVLDHDEHEEYPYGFVSQLRRWGVHEYSLPAEQGGRAGNVETGFNLMRLVARRDSTTATALVITNLSFMTVWIAGSDEQKRTLIAHMKRGGGLSWGLSERAHGSDLIANEMRAERVAGGWLLTGEKWLIGNATVADTMVVHARTGERNGPGAYSIFLVDKWSLDADTVEELPVEKLHGLRALDLSGLRLKGAFVPDSALVGAEGQGLEIALKSTQVARAVISSLALSSVDTALRLTLDFTERRVLFGGTVSDVPYSRRQLVEAFADLMVADAVSLGAVRAIQAAPEQLSVWSSVAKYLAPTLLEKTMSQLNVVIGARYFLRAHPHYGPYQKMLRDLLVANIADGNTVVNLRNLGQQLDGLLGRATTADDEVRAAAAERAAVLFGMDRELPVYDPSRQELFSRGLDDAVLAAPDALRRLRALAEDAKSAERDRLLRAADVAEELLGRAGTLAGRATALKAELGRAYAQSAELFDLAKEYCLVHAAAACVHTYVHSHDVLDDPLPSGAVLLLQLERLRKQLYPHEFVTDQAVVDEVMQVLRHLHRENRLFSHWQFPLAERTDLSAAAL